MILVTRGGAVEISGRHVKHPELRLHQLALALDRRFRLHVHREGIDGKDAKSDEERLRSRAFAAMAAHVVSGMSDYEAAVRVTDYYHDDGIDGFAVSKDDLNSPTLYLVQAKWSPMGKYNFSVGDTSKLVEGLAKLLGDDLHPENLLRAHLGEIKDLMDNVYARVVLVFAASCDKNVSKDVVDEIRKKIGRDFSFPVEVKYLLLEDFVDDLEAEVSRHGVTVSAPLLRDRAVDKEYPRLQGTMSAAALGQWYLDHGRAIFDDNVRVEMRSDVNDEIVECLLCEPENFWYFNNGVTALCEHWQQAPTNGPEVRYLFIGLRIVNGAQTVSSIGRAMECDWDSVAKAQVPIRFIALDVMKPGFGASIAHATNRANPMLPRDFLAMDYVQQRIRDEFMLTLGHTYAIRSNDLLPAAEDGCSVLEALIAVACARHDAARLVDVKGDIASLWHTRSDSYRVLFDDRTTGIEVWRRVRTLRLIRAELERDGVVTGQREKSVAVLGDLLIAHIVFRRLGDEGIGHFESDWEDLLPSVAEQTRWALRSLVAKVDVRLMSGPASKNKVRDISNQLANGRWVSGQIDAILAGRAGVNIDHGRHVPWPSEPKFGLPARSDLRAVGRRCDGGFLVQAGSLADAKDYSSLSTTNLRHRCNLRDSLGFIESKNPSFLRLTRDALFESPSQAAAVLMGHSVNGADGWKTDKGMSYSKVVAADSERGE